MVMNWVDENVQENREGIGYYEVGESGTAFHRKLYGYDYDYRIGFERKGFDPKTGEAGEITLTSFRFPSYPDEDIQDSKFIFIPDEIESNADWWEEDAVTAPVTAIADYFSFNDKENHDTLGSITLPRTLRSVGRCAFAHGCTMKMVAIPESVTEIGEYAFGYDVYGAGTEDECCKKQKDFTVCCYPGTAGERYAKENGFSYKLLSE